MTYHSFETFVSFTPNTTNLWSGAYKIPWNDPEFSRRMLKEHLSQEHDMASRRHDLICKMTEWIHTDLLRGMPANILDLGCGPGFYADNLSKAGHHCLGMDFGPASIEYATEHFAAPNCEFALGDVLTADYKGPHDLVMMLYGELNVFSPAECNHILKRAYASLKHGGTLLLEAYTPEAVRALGSGRSWFMSGHGLFSETAHLCLTESFWVEEQRAALQLFHVLENESDSFRTYKSTTKCWEMDEYSVLLEKTGFNDVKVHETDFGVESFTVISASK